jgi:hypothetical protein
VSKENREVLGDWLLVLAAVLLFASLFLTWSHQLPHALLVLFGTSDTLQSVPRDPTAWQVYSSADILLALFAGGLVAVALTGTRAARIAAFMASFAALVFVIHTIASPPMVGVQNLFSPSNSVPQYYPLSPGAGIGETVALFALLLAIAGLIVSFTTDGTITASLCRLASGSDGSLGAPDGPAGLASD